MVRPTVLDQIRIEPTFGAHRAGIEQVLRPRPKRPFDPLADLLPIAGPTDVVKDVRFEPAGSLIIIMRKDGLVTLLSCLPWPSEKNRSKYVRVSFDFER